jgi:hypothetical protein
MGSGTSPEPLAVKPRDAWRMLGCGNTYGYQLLGAGELESYLDGSSRKITVASIRAYIARKPAAAEATGATMQAVPRRPRKMPLSTETATKTTLPRRRGRPRKTPLSPEART